MPNLEVTATGNVTSAVVALEKLEGKLIDVSNTIKRVPLALDPLERRLAGLKLPTTQVDNFSKKLGTDVRVGANQATTALTNLGRVVQDAPFGFIGIANNINPLLESFQRLKLETGSTKQALASLGSSLLGAGGLGIAVSVASAVLTVFAQNAMKKTGEEADKAGKKVKTFADILDSIVSSIGREVSETAGLIAVLKNETETRDRKLNALKELKKIQPEIFDGLKLEKNAVIGLDAAYVAYLANLKQVIAAKIVQAQIESKVTELLKLEGAANTKDQQAQLDTLKKLISSSSTLSRIKKDLQDTKLGGGFLTDKQEAERIAQLNKEIQGLFDKLTEFSKGIKIAIPEIKVKVDKVDIGNPFDKSSAFIAPPEIPTLTVRPKLEIVPSSVEVKIDPEKQQAMINAINKFLLNEDIKAKINENISTFINDTISNVASGVAEALASGTDVVPRLFDNIIRGVGTQIKELGKYMVQAGIKMLAIKEAIEKLGLSPQTAIIAGFALQVAGALLINAAQKKANTVGFASGGTVRESGFYNVGERGPERIFLPTGARVQPNNELSAYGGGQMVFIPNLTVQGSDLVIAFNRASAQMSRNG